MKKQEIILKWLNKEFGNLTKVFKDDITFYLDKDLKTLFTYFQDSKRKYVFIDYDRIWVFFGTIFGLKGPQTEEMVKIWLEQTYNLRGITPRIDYSF